MFEVVRNKIQEKLDAINEIQEVQEFPSEEFGGFPVAIVKSTRNDSEFETTVENERTYIFTVYLMQDIESQGMRKARRIIEGLVDIVIDAFDKDQILEDVGLQTALPDNKTVIIVFPVMTNLGTTEDQKYVVAELDIKVKISFNIM
jgi:hypothetical protein